MDKDKKGKDFFDRADKMTDKLVEALTSEMDDEIAVPLMLYVSARFTATILLCMQEETLDPEIFDKYSVAVKELMAIIGEDKKIQSIKNKIAENKRQIEEIKQKIANKEYEKQRIVEEINRKSHVLTISKDDAVN